MTTAREELASWFELPADHEETDETFPWINKTTRQMRAQVHAALVESYQEGYVAAKTKACQWDHDPRMGNPENECWACGRIPVEDKT